MGQAFEDFCAKPGPVVIGAAQGASCYGPAYEYTFIIETELRRRKIRDRVPKTGYMIESMVTAAVQNIVEQTSGKPPSHKAT
jgi:hypothetical protein